MPPYARNRFVALALVAVAILFAMTAFGTAAQDNGDAATPEASALQDVHPVAIHAGTCANPAQEPAIALANADPLIAGDAPLVAAEGAAPGDQAVMVAEATVKKKLDDLTQTDAPYALVVHETEITYDTFIACGDIAGPVQGGKLIVGLRPLNGSGIAGIATFQKHETGVLGLGHEETKVHVYLIDDVEALNTGGATAPPPGATATPAPTEAPPATEAATPPAATSAPTQTPTEAASATPGTGQSSDAVTIDMYDIYFNPDSITIPADTPVTVTLTNDGAAQHNFSLNSHGNPNLPANLAQSVNLSPGQSQTITLNLPAGTYYFYCDVPGHEAAGMRGTITAQAGAAVATAETTPPPIPSS